MQKKKSTNGIPTNLESEIHFEKKNTLIGNLRKINITRVKYGKQ